MNQIYHLPLSAWLWYFHQFAYDSFFLFLNSFERYVMWFYWYRLKNSIINFRRCPRTKEFSIVDVDVDDAQILKTIDIDVWIIICKKTRHQVQWKLSTFAKIVYCLKQIDCDTFNVSTFFDLLSSESVQTERTTVVILTSHRH